LVSVAVPVFTVTGAIWIDRLNVRCTTDLAGATATVALGTAGSTGFLVAATTATGIDAGMSWLSTSPATQQSGITAKVIDDNIIITVATATVTGGVLEFELYYHSMSSDGLVAA
jgi:hypothetical protein